MAKINKEEWVSLRPERQVLTEEMVNEVLEKEESEMDVMEMIGMKEVSDHNEEDLFASEGSQGAGDNVGFRIDLIGGVWVEFWVG